MFSGAVLIIDGLTIVFCISFIIFCTSMGIFKISLLGIELIFDDNTLFSGAV